MCGLPAAISRDNPGADWPLHVRYRCLKRAELLDEKPSIAGTHGEIQPPPWFLIFSWKRLDPTICGGILTSAATYRWGIQSANTEAWQIYKQLSGFLESRYPQYNHWTFKIWKISIHFTSLHPCSPDGTLVVIQIYRTMKRSATGFITSSHLQASLIPTTVQVSDCWREGCVSWPASGRNSTNVVLSSAEPQCFQYACFYHSCRAAWVQRLIWYRRGWSPSGTDHSFWI